MYSFANLCRFCKKSDKHFIDITSKIFREIRQIYNILSKITDVELNRCLQQVCQTCFQILTSISDILLECNRTDTVFRKYLANLKTNDKSYAKYECVIKDQVIHYTDGNQCHNTIKNDFVKELNGPSTSNEYNENIIKIEVADQNNDLNDLEERYGVDIIDELNIIPNFCRFCKKSDKHFNDLTSIMFRKVEHFYNILSENMDVELNTCLRQICKTCFQVLSVVSDILLECNRTDTVFRKYLTILKTNNISYAKCECIIKDQVSFYGDINQCHNTSKKGFVKDLNGSSTSKEYNENIIETEIIKEEIVDEYYEQSNSDLNHMEDTNTVDIDELKFIPNEDMNHLYLKYTGHNTSLNEVNYNLQSFQGYRDDSQHKKFNNASKLNRHVHNSTGKCLEFDESIHSNKRHFQCDVCNKTFDHKGHFNTHKRIHTNERPFECDVCDKKFNQIGHLSTHKLIHTNERPFECDACNKKFNKNGSLNRHKRIHTGTRPFECDICNKKFIEKRNLNDHKLIHTGERPFECDVCNKKFRQRRSLIVHKRIHTGELPFECDVCNKKFSLRGSLIVHKRIHTGVFPFKCEVCNKNFNHKGHLNTHNLIHTNEHTFQCDICNKKFYTKERLNEHKGVHTGECSFECDVCNKKFYQKSKLIRHIRIHTGV